MRAFRSTHSHAPTRHFLFLHMYSRVFVSASVHISKLVMWKSCYTTQMWTSPSVPDKKNKKASNGRPEQIHLSFLVLCWWLIIHVRGNTHLAFKKQVQWLMTQVNVLLRWPVPGPVNSDDNMTKKWLMIGQYVKLNVYQNGPMQESW